MPSYKVILNDEEKTELRITADDVCQDFCHAEDSDGNQRASDPWFNFTKGTDDEAITVAAIPFSNVKYITS